MFEDSTMLRMSDELTLFKQVVCNPMFSKVHIFLVLNKKDIFEDLIRRIPLRTCFPDYDGPECDVGEALSYVSQQFRSVMPGGDNNRLTIFFMSARVRREVKCAFDDIFKHILMQAYK
jgi:guanine nucleotide-binding protein G(i) subunit alpha